MPWMVVPALTAAIGCSVTRPNPYEANRSTYAGRGQPEPQEPVVVDVDAVRAYLIAAPQTTSMGRVVGTEIRPDTSRACHAFLSHRYIPKGDPATTIMFSRIGKIGQGGQQETADNGRPAARAFFDWMFGPESPWRSITKDFNADTDWCLKHGVVVGDLDTAPANLVYNFFICTRFPGEYAKTCDWWYSLVQAGVAPWYAFYLCAFNNPAGLGYVGGHGGLSMPDPVRLRDGTPNPKVLTKPGGESTPAAAVWNMGPKPPASILAPMLVGTVTTFGLMRKQLNIQTQINPDFKVLVAACIKEQERIGTESQKDPEG